MRLFAAFAISITFVVGLQHDVYAGNGDWVKLEPSANSEAGIKRKRIVPWSISATKFDDSSDQLNCSGNVRVQIHDQDSILTADEATFDRVSKILKASGNVKLIRKGVLTTGQSYSFKIDSNEYLATSEVRVGEPSIVAQPSTKMSLVKGPFLKEAVALYNRGIDFDNKGEFEQAIIHYASALNLDNRIAPAWCNLGIVYFKQQRYDEAVRSLNQSVALKPRSPIDLNALGVVLFAKGQIDDAMQKWRQIIEISPKFAGAYINLARALEGEGRHAEAVKVIEQLKKIMGPELKLDDIDISLLPQID